MVHWNKKTPEYIYRSKVNSGVKSDLLIMQTKPLWFIPVKLLGKVCILSSRPNMAKSCLLQKEKGMNGIQIWLLALLHVCPNLQSQWDYRGAMSQHFNLTYSLTVRPSLSVWHTLTLPLNIGKASFFIRGTWELGLGRGGDLTDWGTDRPSSWLHLSGNTFLSYWRDRMFWRASHNVSENDPWAEKFLS